MTNTGVSSGRLYWETKLGFFDPKGVDMPVAASVFPDELYQAPRDWAEEAYPNLIHYNRLEQGRALRRLGAAGAFLGRGPDGAPVAPLGDRVGRVHMPSLGGATEWLNSEPLGPAEPGAEAYAFTFG